MSDFQDVIESLGAEDDHRIKVLLNAFKMISDDLQEEREISSSLLGKYDALEAEAKTLKHQVNALRQHKTDYMEAAEGTRRALEADAQALKAELNRINVLANCGSVQNWLKLSDEDKAKWFWLYCQKDDENVMLGRELEEFRGIYRCAQTSTPAD